VDVSDWDLQGRRIEGGIMRRPVLATLIVLGSLVCVIGGTGLFAALTDTARTGTNTVDSSPLAASADIRLATATYGTPVECGTFSEDLASGFFTASGVADGFSAPRAFFCIQNVGSQAVSITGAADELTDVDFACTGDEALHGDATCGGDGAGELSDVLRVSYSPLDCTTGVPAGGPSILLRDNATTAATLSPSLAAGETACFALDLDYLPVSDDAVQKAQSDRVTWRFEFDAQA
jgi:hypothetical protein